MKRYPDSPVFYRKLTRSFPTIVRGEGCWLVDDTGKRYLDASGGAFVANVGHGVQELADAIGAQAARVAYVNGTAFTTPAAEELAAELVKLGPRGLDKYYFLGSGSEAVEAALKLARQYWAERGKPRKTKLIARTPGYHGNTLLALSASARPHYKAAFGGWLVDVAMIPAPYPYRCPCRGEAPDCPACSGSALEDAIRREGADTVCAFIAEPIGGSSTGASVPRPDYYRRVRELCDEHQVLFIADEVLTGAGRTGTWTALEAYGVTPDILTLGKGLSGGYVPLSAVAAGRKLVDTLAAGSGALNHAQTFSHNPVACAAGLAAVRHIARHKLVERCRAMGETLHAKLAALRSLPAVGDVRGRGLLAGVELVEDKASRRPFPRALKVAETFTEAALEEGLVVWPNVGQAGGDGDLLMIAPPFVVAESELDELVVRFSRALERTFQRLKLHTPAGGIP
ncbi:MAG: aspartate aminotransferase family protein [Elusimicrobia bacterium]|nr:aspartate aminotransferase family protein [Elusimicrobiota bacterium]